MEITFPKMKLSRPSWQSPKVLMMVGIVLPLYIVLAANWLISVGANLVQQVDSYLKVVGTAETNPFIYEKILIPLNANDGVWYVVIGILLYIFALILMAIAFRKGNASKIEMGSLKLSDVVTVVMWSLIIGLIFVAIVNNALFAPLIALQQG